MIISLKRKSIGSITALYPFFIMSTYSIVQLSREVGSTDLLQRNGRILRQGNENKEVEIYHYLTEKTFDSYMMSIIVNKQKFISQIMSDKTPTRTCQDVDEMVLNYSEMQAIASGDPRIKEKIELDGEVARLRMLESEFNSSRFSMQNDAARYKKEIKRLTEIAIPKCKSDIEFY